MSQDGADSSQRHRIAGGFALLFSLFAGSDIANGPDALDRHAFLQHILTETRSSDPPEPCGKPALGSSAQHAEFRLTAFFSLRTLPLEINGTEPGKILDGSDVCVSEIQQFPRLRI